MYMIIISTNGLKYYNYLLFKANFLHYECDFNLIAVFKLITKKIISQREKN